MGKIVSFSGPSGVGKTTIVGELLKRPVLLRDFLEIQKVSLITSITTRDPRPDDIPKEYEYVSYDLFDEMKRNGRFAWHTSVRKKQYGTLKTSLEEVYGSEDTLSFIIITEETIQILEKFIMSKFKNAHLKYKYYQPLLLSAEESLIKKRLKNAGISTDNVARRLSNNTKNKTNNKIISRQSYSPHTIENNGDILETTENIIGIIKYFF